MEDARFVRFTGDDGEQTYFAPYTAFDGVDVAPQLLQTTDFRTFHVTQTTGSAARNKGMALFPRKIGGRYAALTRGRRELGRGAGQAESFTECAYSPRVSQDETGLHDQAPALKPLVRPVPILWRSRRGR